MKHIFDVQESRGCKILKSKKHRFPDFIYFFPVQYIEYNISYLLSINRINCNIQTTVFYYAGKPLSEKMTGPLHKNLEQLTALLYVA